MKYWKNLRRERARMGTVTMNMVMEFLENLGYETVLKPTVNASIGAIATADNPRGLAVELENNMGALYIADYIDSAGKEPFDFENRAGSYLIVLRGDASVPKAVDVDEQRCLSRSLAVKPPSDDVPLHQTQVDLANFIISIERFATCLAQAVNSINQYQTLVDVAEDFFENFISIVDPNNMLLAYTKHIKPIDYISKALIKNRYHTDEILAPERKKGYAAERIAAQDGVKVFPPTENIPCTLVTAPVKVNGYYAGYVVMTCEEDEVTEGTVDTFSLFTGFCEKVASLREDVPEGRNPYSQNLLITLLSRKAIDTIFVEQQARQLAIPSIGAYKLIRIIWPEDCTAQIPFFVDEINRTDPHSCVAVRFENAAVVLVYADDLDGVKAITGRIVNSFPANIAYKILISEDLSTLFDIYDGYRALKCVEKYEKAIAHYKQKSADNQPIIRTFRDAFPFYWDDPLRDTSISTFAINHMVISDIERNDTEKGTDDLVLLEAFLLNERKASTVAETHHLHRNGVLYRIKRIQDKYGLDLSDHLTRQYLLSCLRVRAATHV